MFWNKKEKTNEEIYREARIKEEKMIDKYTKEGIERVEKEIKRKLSKGEKLVNIESNIRHIRNDYVRKSVIYNVFKHFAQTGEWRYAVGVNAIGWEYLCIEYIPKEWRMIGNG